MNVSKTASPESFDPTEGVVLRVFAYGIKHAFPASMSTIGRLSFNDAETHAVIGAGIAVHQTMGRGFLEHVYRPCLAIEFHRRQIPFEKEVALPVAYDGIPLPVSFRVDFVCFGSLVVEIKALPSLTSRDEAQLLNYLKASGMQRGLLLNFGSDLLGKRRLVWQLDPSTDPLNGRPPRMVSNDHVKEDE